MTEPRPFIYLYQHELYRCYGYLREDGTPIVSEPEVFRRGEWRRLFFVRNKEGGKFVRRLALHALAPTRADPYNYQRVLYARMREAKRKRPRKPKP